MQPNPFRIRGSSHFLPSFFQYFLCTIVKQLKAYVQNNFRNWTVHWLSSHPQWNRFTKLHTRNINNTCDLKKGHHVIQLHFSLMHKTRSVLHVTCPKTRKRQLPETLSRLKTFLKSLYPKNHHFLCHRCEVRYH